MSNIKKIYTYGFTGNLYFERSIWIVYFLSLNFTLLQVSMIQIILNISMAVSEVPTGIIGDKIGKKKSILIGHLCISIYFLVLLFTKEFFLLILGYIIYGIGLSFISGSDQALIYDSLDDDASKLYQKVLGRYLSICLIALSVSSYIGGVLQKISWSYVFLCGLVFQIVTIFILSFISDRLAVSIEKEKKDNI